MSRGLTAVVLVAAGVLVTPAVAQAVSADIVLSLQPRYGNGFRHSQVVRLTP